MSDSPALEPPPGVVLEGLGGWRRTHTCGELTRSETTIPATLMGWVHRIRDHGGVIFVDLRDRYGLTQVVFRPEIGGPELVARAAQLGHEWVIAVRGAVVMRPAESVNPELKTGYVELDAREMRVLAASAPLPFQVNEEMHLANEDLRLRHRYLDLRRPELARNLAIRHEAALAARRHLSSQSFLEIETPMLVRPTPEGARDYVVPSRLHPGKFYALPQSPQLYKQVLMISGCDRYFQIARCMRDEDLRADRQPEHTQIDVEMSFVTEEDVFVAIEGLMAAIWREVLAVELKTPFPRLTFREALQRFGSDKPDVRFGMEFVDTTALHARSPRRVIAEWAGREDGVGVALLIPGGAEISGTQLRKYEDVVKGAGGGGLSFFKVSPGEREKQQVIFPGELLDEFFAQVKAQPGDAVVFTSGPWEQTLMALGVLRKQLGKPRLKGKENEWAFLWVKEFPLFERDPHRQGWAPRHHMFTMPRPQDLDALEKDPAKVHGILYDLVLNGHELGSGSIRIHRTDIQERVMKVIGLSKEEAYRKFGFLLEAYQYASPPHGGIGLGLDRIVMLLCGRDNIRDVIAFPKTASASSPMDGSPSEVEPETLTELQIRLEPPAH